MHDTDALLDKERALLEVLRDAGNQIMTENGFSSTERQELIRGLNHGWYQARRAEQARETLDRFEDKGCRSPRVGTLVRGLSMLLDRVMPVILCLRINAEACPYELLPGAGNLTEMLRRECAYAIRSSRPEPEAGTHEQAEISQDYHLQLLRKAAARKLADLGIPERELGRVMEQDEDLRTEYEGRSEDIAALFQALEKASGLLEKRVEVLRKTVAPEQLPAVLPTQQEILAMLGGASQRPVQPNTLSQREAFNMLIGAAGDE
jgi:hypothetical protein